MKEDRKSIKDTRELLEEMVAVLKHTETLSDAALAPHISAINTIAEELNSEVYFGKSSLVTSVDRLITVLPNYPQQ